MLARTDNPAEIGLHVFERAGLGKAPFRCVGYANVTYQACPGAPIQPGGSCDYCGTGIMLQCRIKSADGRTFKVGSDCVIKTGDAGLIKSYKNNPQVRAAHRAKAQAKDSAVRTEWTALIAAPATIEKLSLVMVPELPWEPNGRQITILAKLSSLWAMCGAAGRKRTLAALKTRLAA